MALNWAALTENRTPIPLPNEHTITTVDSGVVVHLDIPDVPPSGTTASGGSGGVNKLRSSGSAWLTEQRVGSSRLEQISS